MISITNLPGDNDHMYVLFDGTGGAATNSDFLDVLGLYGDSRPARRERNGTGGKTITDAGNGRLFTVATGASRRSTVAEPLLMNGQSQRIPGSRTPVKLPNVKTTIR